MCQRRTIAGIFCVNQQALSGMNVIMGQTTCTLFFLRML